MRTTRFLARVLLVAIAYSIPFVLTAVSYWLLLYRFHAYWSLLVGFCLVLVFCGLYPWYRFREFRHSLLKTLTCVTTSIALLFFYYSIVYPLAFVFIANGRIPSAYVHVVQLIAFSIISIILVLTAVWCASRLKLRADLNKVHEIQG